MTGQTIILINGSLRARSSHGAVIRTMAELAPPGVTARILSGLEALPHFNPDLDCDPLPPTVVELREAFGAAAAVALSVPEYAGAMPGSVKNMLEWTVGAGSLYEKPVGWINPATPVGRARDTYAGLRLVLGRAGARIVEAACIELPIGADVLDADGAITSADIRPRLAQVLLELVRA